MTKKEKQTEKENTVKEPKKSPNTVDYVKKFQDKSKIKKR